jgi:pimeloyl-ACP methyl ester carboxylesterase
MQSFPDIPTAAIRGITAPALVIVGDADVMRPEHAVETFRLLPHAQLAVLSRHRSHGGDEADSVAGAYGQ